VLMDNRYEAVNKWNREILRTFREGVYRQEQSRIRADAIFFVDFLIGEIEGLMKRVKKLDGIVDEDIECLKDCRKKLMAFKKRLFDLEDVVYAVGGE